MVSIALVEADEIMQVEEETGIKLNVQDMVNLTAFLDPTTSCKVFPSPVILELSLFIE